MNIATIILVYVIAWWMVFFAALPVGVKSQHESPDEAVAGTEPGAPVNPNLKKKILVTSLVALVLTTGYYFLATSDLISFRTPRG
jgi:predicted secreted protein